MQNPEFGKTEQPARVKLTGRVISGARRAAGFTQLDWVQDQCLKKLGFRPYPGTLNVEISAESLAALKALEMQASTALIPPDPAFCEAKVLFLSAGSIPGAMVIPAEDVRIHDKKVIEVIAPVNLRDSLSLKDGDLITLFLETHKIL